MLRATKIVPAGIWHGTPADVVGLDYDRRTRRRIALVGSGGLSFLLDLTKAPVLRSGDGIRLEDGRVVAVEAASERLLEITCRDGRASSPDAQRRSCSTSGTRTSSRSGGTSCYGEPR